MNFWKTSFWATISAVAKLSSQFIVAKVIAVSSGAAAFGIIGQFQSFVSLVQIIAGGVMSSGVTKYAAEYHHDRKLLKIIFQTVAKFGFVMSILTGILIASLSFFISKWIFQDQQYWWLIAVFGITLFGFTINQLFLAALNGLNKMRAYAALSAIGAIFSILITGSLAYFFREKGALAGVVGSQLCLFFSIYFFGNNLAVKVQIFNASLDYMFLKKLLKFSLMAIISAVLIPVTQMIIRTYVAAHSNWTEVGYWQGVSRISDAYLMIITMIISTYALPQYSRIADKRLLKKEVFSVMRRLLPMAALSAACIYFFRREIIVLLFSRDFLPMQQLFFFQLLGDVVKIMSWVMANVLVAKARVKMYAVFEVVFLISYLVLSMVLFNYFSIQGLMIAFFLNYIGYFSVVFLWFIRFAE